MINAKDFLKEAKLLAAQLSEDRRWLHSHAESGFELNDTVGYVENALSAIGCRTERCGRSGIAATIGSGDKCILLRADMDALPIKEQSGEAFACTSGNMHACGHDMHTAILLGAARLLKAHEDELCGTVKLMFQPAEELLEGAKDMIADGLLAAPVPDAAVMIHAMTGVDIPVGTILVAPSGVSAPAADFFTIEIKGKGCHGSSPATGIDPINCAAHIITALQEIISRELAITQRAALTIGSIHAGSAANVIPDEAELRGSLRCYDDDTRAFIRQRLCDISSGIASVFRAEASVTFDSGCPTLINDDQLREFALNSLTDLLGSERCIDAQRLSGGSSSLGGSEDFAYISHEVKTSMLALSAGCRQDGFCHTLHHPEVRFDEAALPVGCAAYAYLALRWLSGSIS